MNGEARAKLEGTGGSGYRLSGELDFASVPALARSLPAVFEDGGEVTVDLSGVTRSNSAGMALLLEMQRLARERNCRLSLLHLPRSLHNIIHISELDTVLPLSD